VLHSKVRSDHGFEGGAVDFFQKFKVFLALGDALQAKHFEVV